MATSKMFNLLSEFLRIYPPNLVCFDKKRSVLCKTPTSTFKVYLGSYLLFATVIVTIQMTFFIKKVIYSEGDLSDSQKALFLLPIYICMLVIAINCLHCMIINDSFWVAFNTFSNFHNLTKGKQPTTMNRMWDNRTLHNLICSGKTTIGDHPRTLVFEVALQTILYALVFNQLIVAYAMTYVNFDPISAFLYLFFKPCYVQNYIAFVLFYALRGLVQFCLQYLMIFLVTFILITTSMSMYTLHNSLYILCSRMMDGNALVRKENKLNHKQLKVHPKKVKGVGIVLSLYSVRSCLELHRYLNIAQPIIDEAYSAFASAGIVCFATVLTITNVGSVRFKSLPTLVYICIPVLSVSISAALILLFPAATLINESSQRVLERVRNLVSRSKYLSRVVRSERKLRFYFKPLFVAKKSSDAALVSFIVDSTTNGLLLNNQ